jgi:hypothetical protein
LWASTISMPRKEEDLNGSYLGLPELQHHPMVQHTAQDQHRSSRLRGAGISSGLLTLKKVHLGPRNDVDASRQALSSSRTGNNEWVRTTMNCRRLGAIHPLYPNLSQLPVPRFPPRFPPVSRRKLRLQLLCGWAHELVAVLLLALAGTALAGNWDPVSRHQVSPQA